MSSSTRSTATSAASARGVGIGKGNGETKSGTDAVISNSSATFAPSPDSQTFRDLLIFEERLKQNAARLLRRKKKYQTFLALLLLAIAFFGYQVLFHEHPASLSRSSLHGTRDRERDWEDEAAKATLLRYFNVSILLVLATMLSLFFASGMYAERITAANKFVPQANRSLRSFNMYLNTRTAPRHRRRFLSGLWGSLSSSPSSSPSSTHPVQLPTQSRRPPQQQLQQRTLGHSPSGARRLHIPTIPPSMNPRGELIFSSKVSWNFRDGYERYRAAFERRRREKLQERSRSGWRRWYRPLLDAIVWLRASFTSTRDSLSGQQQQQQQQQLEERQQQQQQQQRLPQETLSAKQGDHHAGRASKTHRKAANDLSGRSRTAAGARRPRSNPSTTSSLGQAILPHMLIGSDAMVTTDDDDSSRASSPSPSPPSTPGGSMTRTNGDSRTFLSSRTTSLAAGAMKVSLGEERSEEEKEQQQVRGLVLSPSHLSEKGTTGKVISSDERDCQALPAFQDQSEEGLTEIREGIKYDLGKDGRGSSGEEQIDEDSAAQHEAQLPRASAVVAAKDDRANAEATLREPVVQESCGELDTHDFRTQGLASKEEVGSHEGEMRAGEADFVQSSPRHNSLSPLSQPRPTRSPHDGESQDRSHQESQRPSNESENEWVRVTRRPSSDRRGRKEILQ